MLTSLVAAWKLPDLRKRILFVFGMFAIYVVGLHIMVPGVDRVRLAQMLERGGLLNLVDAFTGGALRTYSIFAMGIMPYINASIIMSLLTIAIPALEELHKEGGELGRKKISQYTRYLTVVLALFQAFGTNIWLQNAGALGATHFGFLRIMLTLTAGTAFLMWMGEQITDKGVGNGVSLVIFCGITVRMPYYLNETWKAYRGGAIEPANLLLFAFIFLASITFIVLFQQAERKIPVQYAKRVVGTKMYGGQSTYLPIKVNTAGVIPIIFAISILYFPATILGFINPSAKSKLLIESIMRFFSPGESPWASLLYAGLIIFFTYFYTAVVWNPIDVADNIKKWGGFIPGIRPGKPTAEYLYRILVRVTLAGAIFLAIVALLQYWVPEWTHIHTWGSIVGGTSLLIVVGVALETMQQIEAHLLLRRYEGFIK
ncbi:MAG: preprotein translocase subunit SecY [candidate division WOR-3 bacterium]